MLHNAKPQFLKQICGDMFSLDNLHILQVTARTDWWPQETSALIGSLMST